MTAPTRRKRRTLVMEVIATERLTEHLVRVHIGGPALAEFTDNGCTDRYVKIHFAKPELGLTPPYDLDELREQLPPEDLPVTRTYTIRSVGADSLAIDFVVHGDEGVAGPWAAAAKPGDLIAFSGPGGAYRPDPEADAHLLAGDESALPAVAAALEELADHLPDAVGTAYLEVYGRGDELPLRAPRGVEIRWLHRGSAVAGTSTALADALAAHPWPAGRVQVFAHGERESMKAVRDVMKTRAVPRSDLSLSGYWAYGRSEDRFQAEKREPIGVIL